MQLKIRKLINIISYRKNLSNQVKDKNIFIHVLNEDGLRQLLASVSSHKNLKKTTYEYTIVNPQGEENLAKIEALDHVSVIKSGTSNYYSKLATAKVIITDGSIKQRLVEREGQTIVTLTIEDNVERAGMSARQHNARKSKYIIGEHIETIHTAMKNIGIDRIYQGTLVVDGNYQSLPFIIKNDAIDQVEGIQIHQQKCPSNVVVYGGKLKNKMINHYIRYYLEDLVEKEQNVVFLHSAKYTRAARAYFETLPEEVSVLGQAAAEDYRVYNGLAEVITSFSPRLKHMLYKQMESMYKKECQHLMGDIKAHEIISVADYERFYSKLYGSHDLGAKHCIYEVDLHKLSSNDLVVRMRNKFLTKLYKDRVVKVTKENLQSVKEVSGYYNSQLRIINVSSTSFEKENHVGLKALGFAIHKTAIDLNDFQIYLGEKLVHSNIRARRILPRLSILSYDLRISVDEMQELPIHNKVIFYKADRNGNSYQIGAKYNLHSGKNGMYKRHPLLILEECNTTAYFRQSAKNSLFFTVRRINMTDEPGKQKSMNLAAVHAKLKGKKNIILLYEKESSRYEESASVLYEKLIDQGYKNVYFILDESYAHQDQIPKQYKANIVAKGSYKHFLLFFMAKTFIGSETMGHAIDLRVANVKAQTKLNSKENNFIFLQHGVMYMVSLSSETRAAFKPLDTRGKYRVVTSSELEANHFIELGRHKPRHVYVTGLPKFDKNTINENPDKIVIMPTWRPWEYNFANLDFTDTKYYKMVERIVDAIPEELKTHIVILPHPLFYSMVADAEFPLKKYLNITDKYDDILKDTRVLITDYSSIAYDAFYRGSNVIFYWEEKDESMENYGPSTKLMLNEENVYGDVCYNGEDLSKIIMDNYQNPQTTEQIEKYRQIVSFHDGNNTQRVIEMMKEDHII